MLTLGEKLRVLRRTKNLSQKKVSDTLNISLRSLVYYENNEQHPTGEAIKKLCQFYQVSADWLLGLSDKQSIHSSVSALTTLPETTTNESESNDPWEKVFAMLQTMDRNIVRDIAETNARIDRLYDNLSVPSPTAEDEEAVALETAM
jgi:transcriptional regulator with XRE-family HTH domain